MTRFTTPRSLANGARAWGSSETAHLFCRGEDTFPGKVLTGSKLTILAPGAIILAPSISSKDFIYTATPEVSTETARLVREREFWLTVGHSDVSGSLAVLPANQVVYAENMLYVKSVPVKGCGPPACAERYKTRSPFAWAAKFAGDPVKERIWAATRPPRCLNGPCASHGVCKRIRALSRA